MPIFIWDMHTFEILEFNGIAQEQYGYTREELLKMTVLDLREPHHHEKIKAFARRFNEEDITKMSGIWEHITRTGEKLILDISSHKIDYKGRQAILAIHNNITERVRLEEKLEEERLMKQKEITEATIRVQEKERYDIATELHDNVNQQLTVSMMYIASAQQKYPDDAELLKQSTGFIMNAIEEIRKLSQILVTPVIRHFGLSKAIEGLVEDIATVNKFQIELIADSFTEDDIKYDFKLNIFRMVQEMMNNIVKHAQASHVQIELSRGEDSIDLKVQDNGIGFDVSQQRKGIGIHNIINRADLYNGKVNIKTAPGEGCSIYISFPIQQEGVLM
jgi:PAS domain S-box-containing protein